MSLRKIFLSLVLVVFALGGSLTFFEDADAKRFGGGRSFGSSRSYSQPAPKPVSPTRNTNEQSTKPNQAGQSQPTAPTNSRFGGMGGMLGGLLMGGLIGSMLFGGAFNGIGMFDMLIIGALIFFAFRFFRSRMAQQNTPNSQGAGVSYRLDPPPNFNKDRALSQTSEGMFNSNQPNAAYKNTTQTTNNSFGGGSINLPEGFNVDEFINGAKSVYIKIQEAWDKRDASIISSLLTPEMMLAVRKQIEDSPKTGKTDLLLVNAELVSFDTIDNLELAGVYFFVTMREDDSPETLTAHELWTFVRENNGSWLLDGLQQTEE